MKYILSAVVFFFATGVFAQQLEFKHFSWQDIMEKRMGLWCRKSNTDCGVFIRDTPDLKTIKWNKWGVEIFRRNKDGVYELVPSNAMDKDEKIALEIESEYGQLEYTFKNPYVKLNPYTRAPLSALIKFPTEQPAEVTLTIFGIKPAEDIVHTFKGFKTQHEIPVIGLYANHQNQIKLTARYQTGKTEETNISIQTGRISNEMLYQILS
ncbi:MAG: aryl-sulfate sulfotransferase N-terminal domain-containing protein, partial [Alphaproteobacteria bacterium]